MIGSRPGQLTDQSRFEDAEVVDRGRFDQKLLQGRNLDVLAWKRQLEIGSLVWNHIDPKLIGIAVLPPRFVNKFQFKAHPLRGDELDPVQKLDFAVST